MEKWASAGADVLEFFLVGYIRGGAYRCAADKEIVLLERPVPSDNSA